MAETLGKSRVAGKTRKAVSFDESNIANTSAKHDDDIDVIIGAAARKRSKLDAADSERDEADLQNSSESDSSESDSENEESGSESGEKPSTGKRKKVKSVEGEEDETLISYNGVRITPFNMREELEEGEIDSGGNFVYSRDKLRKTRMTTDNWLDSLDYISLPDTVPARPDSKAKAKGAIQDGKDGSEPSENTAADESQPGDGEEENEESSDTEVDQASVMRELFNLLDAADVNETLLLAIKRHGRSVQRGPKSKAKSKTEVDDETDKDHSKKQLLRLTELADTLMSQFGMTNAYDLTRRDVQSWLSTHASSGSDNPSGKTADDDADMFSDAFEEESKPEGQPQPASTGEHKWELPEVAWELKWSASEGTVYGLFSSVQMDAWLTAGYFATRPDCDALVRKVDTQSLRTAFERRFGPPDLRDTQPISVNGNELTEEQLIALTNGSAQLESGIGTGPFYNVKRMDFSLYID